jgi:hypothetical protein
MRSPGWDPRNGHWRWRRKRPARKRRPTLDERLVVETRASSMPAGVIDFRET